MDAYRTARPSTYAALLDHLSASLLSAVGVLSLIVAATALSAVEVGFPITNQYAPGQHIATFAAGISPGNGRLSRIAFHQGWLVTNGQGGGDPTLAWDVSDFSNIRRMQTFGSGDSGAHNFGFAQGALIFGGQQFRAAGHRLPLAAVSVYSPWEWGKLYSYPIAITAEDGYNTQSSTSTHRFFDLRTNATLGTYRPFQETGIIGKPILIGNLLLLAGHHHRGGVAAYDVSDFAAPRLLDVLPGIGGYEPAVWGNLLCLANGSAAESLGQPHGLIFIDFSDPTNLRVAHTISTPNYYGDFFRRPATAVHGDHRYMQFQDEYMFVGHSKVDMRTFQAVTHFEQNQVQFTDYLMPFGNFVAIGGLSDGNVRIYCHQREPDTRAPFINYRNPAANQVNVNVRGRVGFVINETLDATTLVSGDTIVIRPVGGTAISAVVGASDGDVINVTPNAPLAADTTYEVVLRAGGIRDVAGNGIAATTWRFSTGPTISGGTPPANQAPTVSLTAPAANATFTAPAGISLTATAADTDGSVTQVQFFAGSTLVGTDTTAPYAVTWSNVAAGTYSLTARATDNAGAVTTSAARSITVTAAPAANQPPTVALSAPAANATFTAPASIALTATAADSDGSVSQVQFYAGNTLVGTDTTAPYAVTWSNVAAGTYSLTARATDNAGAVTTSAARSITVTAAPVASGPYGGTRHAIPGTIQAEHYDLGGEGVGFHDTDAVNQGSATLRGDGVDLEAATDTGGGVNIGYVADGEWWQYAVTATAGRYDVDVRVASAAATPGSFRVSLGDTVLGTVAVPNTGGWQTWTTVTLPDVGIAAGNSSLRLTAVGAGMNVNWVAFRARANRAPAITDIQVAPHPVGPGQSVTLTAVASDADGDALRYRWTLGDGRARTEWSSSASLVTTWANVGHYGLVLQVEDPHGAAATANRSVTVAPTPPTAARGTASGPIVLHAAARRVVVVNPDTDTVTAIHADTLARQWEVAVGRDPRGVAVDSTGRFWVACRGSDELVVLTGATGAIAQRIALPYGSAPVQVVFNAAGSVGYVSAEGSGRIGRIRPASTSIDAWLPCGPTVRALALSGDGSQLFATRFRSSGTAGTVWQIATSTFTISRTIALAKDPGPDSPGSGRGVPSYLAGIGIDPSGQRLWIAGNKFNVDRGPLRDGLDPTTDNMVRTMVAPVRIADGIDVVAERIDIDNSDSAAAVAFSPLGDWLFVAMQGNDSVQVIDLLDRTLTVRLPTGSAPQGLVHDPATDRLFVMNFLSRDVSVLNVGDFLRRGGAVDTSQAAVRTIASERLSATVLTGKRHFYRASDARMSTEGYISCASCHVDGSHEGMTWDFSARGEGIRNTISLHGRRGTGHGRLHWSANFDEVQDFEHDMRAHFGGTGFLSDADFNAGTRNTPLGDPKAGRSAALDALAAYVTSLDAYPRSPHRQADGSATPAAVRGRAVFARLDCQSCHGGDDFTDSITGRLHNIGTITPNSGQRLGATLTGIDTPTLRGLWDTAPYLHNGSAATLDAVFNQGPSDGAHGQVRGLSSAERSDLLAFLVELDGQEPAVPPTVVASEWTTGDIGSVAAVGSAVESNGTWTVRGSGADIWNRNDAFQFISRPVTDDVRITARVASFQHSHAWSKAGVMIRAGRAANARHVFTCVTGQNGLAYQRRTTTGGASSHTGGPKSPAPYWVRIERIGSLVTSSVSHDGTTWQVLRRETVALGTTVEVGLAVTSHQNGVISTAVFTDVSVISAPTSAN